MSRRNGLAAPLFHVLSRSMSDDRFRQQPKRFRDITPNQRIGWVLVAVALLVLLSAVVGPESFSSPF